MAEAIQKKGTNNITDVIYREMKFEGPLRSKFIRLLYSVGATLLLFDILMRASGFAIYCKKFLACVWTLRTIVKANFRSKLKDLG